MNRPPAPYHHLSSVSRVVELHEAGIRAHGGLQNAPKSGCVESALGNAWSAECYRDKTEFDLDGLTFASATLLYLAVAHCFGDGNKRVAWAAMCDILAKAGLTLEVNADDAESFVLGIAQGALRDHALVVEWIAERLVALPEASAT